MLDHITATVDVATAALPLEVPNPGDGAAPPGSGKFKDIMGWVKWLCLGVLVVALMARGAMFSFGRGHEGGEAAAAVGRVLVGVIIVSAAFTTVGLLIVG